MWYVLDGRGRVILASNEECLARQLAVRIIAAGAPLVYVAEDKPTSQTGKLGKEGVFTLEYPEDVHIDPATVEKIVEGKEE